LFKFKKRSSIRLFFLLRYKIINREINNFNTWKILENRLKKNKNSSKNATLNHLLFENPLHTNIPENNNEKIKIKIG